VFLESSKRFFHRHNNLQDVCQIIRVLKSIDIGVHRPDSIDKIKYVFGLQK